MSRPSPPSARDGFDPDALAQELVKTLRGARSQMQFSRRIGRRSNVAYIWESGRSYPSASELFAIIGRLKGDPRSVCREFVRAHAGRGYDADPGTPEGVGAFLSSIVGDETAASMATELDVSRSTMHRWLTGKTQPRLHELLAIVQASTRAAGWLVEALVLDVAKVESTKREIERRVGALMSEEPLLLGVVFALQLPSYTLLPKHRVGYLADRLGISIEEEERGVRMLLDQGLLEWNGERYTFPAPWGEPGLLEFRAERPVDIRRFWAQQAASRLGPEHTTVVCGVLIATADDIARLERVRGELIQVIREIAHRTDGDRIALVNFNVMELGPPEPPPA